MGTTRIAAALVATLLAGCSPASEDPSVGSGAPIEATVAGPLADPFVSHSWLADHISDPDLVLLEVGADDSGYLEGRIAGARFLAFSDLVVEVDGIANEIPPADQLEAVFEAVGVSDESMVVVYGAPLRAARALLALAAIGLSDRAAILQGDAESWAGGGGELLTGDPDPVDEGDLAVRMASDLVVDAEWVSSRLGAPGVAFLDARPADQYTGETPGNGVERGGHIPGAVNIWWEETTSSTDPLELLDEDALRARFAAAGIQPGDTVVTYCRTGVQASMAWAVSELLGYETRIYDASWMEWNLRPELPVEEGS